MSPEPGSILEDTQAAGQQLADTMTENVVDGMEPVASTAVNLLNTHAIVFVIAFVVALLSTPLVRLVAIRFGVVDCPDDDRKKHRVPTPYLGGIAVFLGILAGIGLDYLIRTPAPLVDDGSMPQAHVPISIIIGMFAILLTGLADDVWDWDPRTKIAGQLVAAAALAMENVGVLVAHGLLMPFAEWIDPVFGTEGLVWTVYLFGGEVPIDIVYWMGTALIALFVLGGSNAANLIDGLDGLLTGVTSIVAIGLLIISLLIATVVQIPEVVQEPLGSARIVMCLALLGATLGFLPHNFNPATIFLGDCGSHLLGYMVVVIVLMLGEYGQTQWVFAGLIIFSIPIMDAVLAIVRRRLRGVPMSAADHQHIHHQLKQGLGGVKKAVLALYGIGFAFMVLGVTLAALDMLTNLRVRIVYCIALVLFGFIAVIAVKSARQPQRIAEAESAGRRRAAGKATTESAKAVRPTTTSAK